MIWWILFLTVLTILSYLADIGAWTYLMDLKVPFLHASALSVLLLLCTLGILVRMMSKRRAGEKELLRSKVTQLEREVGVKKTETA